MAKQFGERDTDGLIMILDHCDRIDACVKRFGNDFKSYLQDIDYQDAVKMNLLQIGEISNRLSEECTNQITELPWHQIYGLRNVIAHGYETLVEERIWDTIDNDIPKMRRVLYDLLVELGEIE